MSKKNTFFLALFLSFIVIFTVQGAYAQLNEDYDRRERAVDPFEDEDNLLRKKKIKEIINRIRRGDRTVLRLVVFDTFEAVHDEIVKKDKTDAQKNYYDILGGRNSLSAFIGGFDNQDPKVRLKCIGYLGDWVDEVGRSTKQIEKAVDKRLATNIETRKEVRYGFRVLKMKIVRRRILSAVKRGDQKVLVRVPPEEYLPLVFYEPRIRTIYLGSPGAVRIRSIVLDPGVEPETGNLVSSRPGRAQGLDIERLCYQGVTRVGDLGEVAQWLQDVRQRGTIANAAATGGYVGGGVSGSGKTAGGKVVGKAKVDWKCVKAIYTGIDNKSLFVREHSARIFLNYIRGYTGDPNYLGNVQGTARSIAPELRKMATNPYYVRLAQVAWDNVKWSEYEYNDRVTSSTNYLSFVQHKHYREFEYSAGYNGAAGGLGESRASADESRTVNTKRYFTEDATSFPEWGTEITGNYRNDVKELLRVLGLAWYIDAEYIVESEPPSVESARIDTLFNDRERADRPRRPDRSDRLEGESSTSFIGGEQR